MDRFVVALVAAACLPLIPACGGAAKDPYVKANERLLALAKPYPGAKVIRLESAPYGPADRELGPTIGYTTVAYYHLDHRVAPLTVAAFYRRELPGWQQRITRTPCRVAGMGSRRAPSPATSCPSAVHVEFRKGQARISLELDGLTVPDGASARASYDVSVDHA